jgi:putative DNA primase/helicase
MNDARAIARALGGDLAGRHTVLCPGPGHSHQDRSLAVRLDPHAPDGFVTYSHAGDDWRECRDLIRSRLGLPAWQLGEDDRQRAIPLQHIPRWDFEVGKHEWSEPPTADDLERISGARKIWDESRDPRGTLVETYLRSRALDLTDELAGNVLRFHPQCPWRIEDTGLTDRVPALIAAFRSIDDDEITGIHRIALRSNGGKIGRRMLGIIRSAAVKLAPITAGLLAIGEGVETAMAAQQLGVRPAWALGGVGAITFFPVIERVHTLVLLGESGMASTTAIMRAGARWRMAGRIVQVRMPLAGSDLNDELMRIAQ